MYLLRYLRKIVFETLLSFQGLKGLKRPIVPKGRSPLIPLGIHDSPPPGKLYVTLPVNQCVTSSPSPIPPTIQVLRTKDYVAWCSWLSGHLARLPSLRLCGFWPHSACHPSPCHPCVCHPSFWPPLPLHPYPASPWTCDFHPPTPTLARPILFLENRSIINHACTLRDSMIFNSLLCWWEELCFWKFLLEHWQHMLGSKIWNAPENYSFVASFMHLKLRKEPKENYMEAGTSKVGTGLQDSQQNYVLSLGWLQLISSVLTQMHRNNSQGFLKAKIRILLKKLYAWGMTITMTCPVRNL